MSATKLKSWRGADSRGALPSSAQRETMGRVERSSVLEIGSMRSRGGSGQTERERQASARRQRSRVNMTSINHPPASIDSAVQRVFAGTLSVITVIKQFFLFIFFPPREVVYVLRLPGISAPCLYCNVYASMCLTSLAFIFIWRLAVVEVVG